MKVEAVRPLEEADPELAAEFIKVCNGTHPTIRAIIEHENDIHIIKKTTTPVTSLLKIGRNDPCPCGSDKKYKRCCKRK